MDPFIRQPVFRAAVRPCDQRLKRCSQVPGTAPQPQLNRMLLDDFFQADYFTRESNWGSNLTGFRIYYRTVLYANGQKIEQTSRQDLSLSDVTLYRSSDIENLPIGLYSASWKIAAGSLVWARVAPMVNGMEGASSGS